MPTQRAVSSPHVSRWWPRRSSALLALLVLGVSCASDMFAELPEREHEQQFQGTAAAAETDAEERVLAVLPTNFPATRISQEQFTKALVGLMKDLPLPVKDASRPLPHPGRRIVLTSSAATGEAWHSPLAQDYRRFCVQRGSAGDCLIRFDDGPELDADDKRAIALALAIGPALDAADAEIRTLISPTRLLTLVSISITGYMALLVVPEPISNEAEQVLEELVRTQRGILRFTARLTLEQWREGTFNPP